MKRNFVIFVYHELKPSGPLINRLKWFCSKIHFHEDIRKISDSAESEIEISANPKLANTARSRTLRRLTLRADTVQVKQIFQIFKNLQFQGM